MTRRRRTSVLVAVTAVAWGLGLVSPTIAATSPVGSSSSSSPNLRSTITLNRPQGTSAGHLMVAAVAVNTDAETITPPEGWSLVRDDTIPGAVRQAVYVKPAGDAEPATYTWVLPTARRVAGGITAYSGVDAANPLEASEASRRPQPGNAIAAPVLTTSVPDTRLVLLTAVAAEGWLTPAAGLEKRWQAAASDAATSSDVLLSAADTAQTEAGPTAPLSTQANQAGPAIAALLALRPAVTPLPPDIDPPDTTIDAGPPATVATTTATFVFSADEPASYTCALDGAVPATCSSPATYSGLTAGPHSLTVTATDTAGNTDPAPQTRVWTVEPGASSDPVLVGAGDIAHCTSQGDEATAALVESIPGTVFTAGDNAYVNGTAKEFANCYDPTWGRFKGRTMPAPGNHEYQSDPAAAGYYQYFGAAAGDPTKGYYDYTLGSWHVIVLNSVCWAAGGCGPGSPQEQWLRTVLASSRAPCTVAITHHARFSSAALHGSTPTVAPLWTALYEHGADLVLSGHDHVYERFAMQTPAGVADPVFGLRQFTVGMGGRDHRRFANPIANSEVRNSTTFGVLKLTLQTDRYHWEFVPEAGKSFTDRGTGACHGAPPPVAPPTRPPVPIKPVVTSTTYPPPTDTPVPSTTTPTS